MAVIEPLETNYDLNYYINPRTTEKNAYNRSYVSCNVPYKFTVYCTSNYNNKPTGDFENKWYIYTEETVKPAGTMSNIMYHTNTYMYLNEIYASDDIYWTTMDTETPTTELAKAENMEMFVSNDGLAYRPSTFSTDISQYRISSANIDYSMLVNGGKDFFLGYSSWFPAWYLGTVEPLEPNANVTFYTNPYDSTYKSYNRVYITCDVPYKFTVYCTSNYNNLSIADGPQNKWYYYVNETTVPAGSMQNIMYHTYTSMNFTDVQVTNNVKWLQMNTSTPTIGYGKRWSLPRLNTK